MFLRYKYPLYNPALIRAILPDLQEALTGYLGARGVEFAILVRVLLRANKKEEERHANHSAVPRTPAEQSPRRPAWYS